MAANALRTVDALPAHVILEAYSVLTRLPAGLAVSREDAARVISTRFDRPALQLDAGERGAVLGILAGAGVFGGATYDGLVALEAVAHGRTLLTLDRRAQSTYQRLGIAHRVIAH
jgi:hypothetical protein